jgi:hypothetical protein
MKKIILVDKKGFIDWIKAQPDDRPMDMAGSSNTDRRCKCPMVQYAEENFPKGVLPEEWACGYSVWEDQGIINDAVFAKFKDGKQIDHFIKSGVLNDSKTFGELKKSIIA